jgi:hypothetical protein
MQVLENQIFGKAHERPLYQGAIGDFLKIHR